MVTTTKKSNDYSGNGFDMLINSSSTKSSNKVTSETSNFDNDKKVSNKKDDFREVLNSKTNSRKQDDNGKVGNDKKADDTHKSKASNEVTNQDKIDELKEKLKELEEDSKSDSDSKDKVNDVLKELLSLLSQLGIKEDDLKLNGKINSDVLKNLVDNIDKLTKSNSNMNDVMSKIMELLKVDSVKNNLDADSLKSIQKLLGNLSASLADDNSDTTKEVKNNLKSLMSEISNMLNDKQGQTKKVLTLEEMLSKDYSQNNSGNSTDDESSNTTTSKDTKELNKEDKFLNSLIDDDKDNATNKINLFASRNTAVQNQGVNTTVRGLTINKGTFVSDLIKDVKYMSSNSIKELTVKLNPGNLGEIAIKLVQEDGLMKANIKADSKETTALLSQNLAEIKKQLSEQNIKVSDVNIELYQDDTTFFKDQGFEGHLSGENKQNNKAQSTVTSAEGIVSEETDENLAQENSEINFFA